MSSAGITSYNRTSGPFRRTSRMTSECLVTRGGSATKFATGVRCRPFSLDHLASFVSVGPVSFTTVKDATQEPLAARAACWLAICSFIFCCISLGVGCALWVATIQV
jgi:hypothetical protein